jgi:hypothetical protein
MKYPIGIQDFESLRTNDYTYVDKTSLIYKLANEGKYYFLSRPRRFGKSLLVSTLSAYFSGKRELFKGLAMEQLEKDWKKYPVLHIDLNTDKYDSKEVLEQRLNLFLSDWEEHYGRNINEVTLSQRFEGIIKRIAIKEGMPVVILVDEYDKPMLQAISNKELQTAYRNTLKAFYGALKSQDKYIRFAFLTGVTKFGKVSVFSDLNNLTDISMDARYQAICGITEKEMHEYFEEGIKFVAENNELTIEETCEKLRKRYDGYHFHQKSEGIYNPFSLLNTFAKGEFGSYWFETGTPTFLVQLLQRDKFYLPDLTEQQVTADFLNSIDSIDESPIPIIYQSGYLTIKDYDKEFQIYTLGFPNEEVEEGFTNFLMPYYMNTGSEGGPMFIRNFVMALRLGKPEAFMKRMQVLFADSDYKIVGDAELYFQNAFYVVTKLLGFYVDVERTISDGRIDMVAKTKDYIYIFEFKYDKDAHAALQQIEDKGYAKPFAADKRKLIKVGVNFSRQHRCIDDWKVEE